MRLTKDHLEFIFIATGQKVPATKMDELLQLAQSAMHWNPASPMFNARFMWNAEHNMWGFYLESAPGGSQ